MRTAEEEIACALERGDVAAVHYWQSVIRVADEAPEFTPALRDQLQILLRPDPTPVKPVPAVGRRIRTRFSPAPLKHAA